MILSRHEPRGGAVRAEAVGVFPRWPSNNDHPEARAILAGSDDAANSVLPAQSGTNSTHGYIPWCKSTDQVRPRRVQQLTSKVGRGVAFERLVGRRHPSRTTALSLEDT
jgi:hypothetical protein